MNGKCDYESCSNNAVKLFFGSLSGIRIQVCNEHFQILQEEEQQERVRLGLPKTESIIFNEEAFFATRGREH